MIAGSSPSPLSPASVATSPGSVRVSFIVPLYNGLALTQAMLASLRATVPSRICYEIILIDDGSTDGTREWLATLNETTTHVLLNERNLGFAATNNRAVATARGELLVLLNNDLVLLPGWFGAMLAAHRCLGRIAGLVGNVQVDAKTNLVDHTGITFDLKAKPEHDRHPVPRWERAFRSVRPVPAVTAACVMIATSLWRQLGGFDEGYVNGGEDVDLCLRARAAGKQNAVALHSVVRHHVSASAGRKLRDEANSERLARRWHREFAECAARGWCREYLRTIFPRPDRYDASLARRVALHALGLSAPPAEAIAALESSLELEFARWEKIAGR